MIKTLEFFYYCFYSSIRKTPGDSSPRRASFGLSTAISLYFFSLCLLIVIVFRLQIPSSSWKFSVPAAVIFLIIGRLVPRFLVDSKRYITIIESYNGISKRRKNFYIFIGIISFVFSFVSYIYTSILFNDYAKSIIEGR